MNRKRQKMVQKHIEITDYENRALRALMERGGYRKEAHLIRDLIMNTTPIEIPKEAFDSLVKEFHKIGTNINQIAHMANAAGYVDVSGFEKEAEKLSGLCFEIQKLILEPFRKREMEEIIHDLAFMDFGTPERNEESIKIMKSLLSLLERNEADGSNENLDDS